MENSAKPPRRIALQQLGAFSIAAAFATPRAFAQTYPDRPIRIVPFGAAGGPIDIITRLYGDKLRALWGQPIVVDPKPGASGIIAADFVAKAPPDGHTLMFTLPLTHVNAAILNPKLPYDPLRDFEPISMLGTGSPLMLTRADAPYSSLKEYVAHVKRQGKSSYDTWGIGSGAHLYGELLKRQAGIDMVHVPYRAEAGSYNDLFGGVLDAMWANPGSARGHLQAGKVKILGVAGSRRMSLFPAVSTFAEQGFTGFDIDSWIGVYAPAKTPATILEKLTTAMREITRLPDVQARLLDIGFEPLGNTAAEFFARYKADYPRLSELIKAAGVTAE